MQTKYESIEQLLLPEFSDKKNITWHFSLFKGNEVGYNVVIGRDLMLELGMEISFTKKTVAWEGIEILIRDFTRLRKWNISRMEMKAIIQELSKPIVTQEVTDRIIKILDSKYKKANLRVVIDSAKHLTLIEREKLYKVTHQIPRYIWWLPWSLEVRQCWLWIKRRGNALQSTLLPSPSSLQRNI